MQRIGTVIGLKPEKIADYKRLHAAVWPEVLRQIKASGISNYSIFLREPENLLFAYYEYNGSDHDADMAADPRTQEWWAVCMPLQVPLATRAEGEWWTSTDEVFHLD